MKPKFDHNGNVRKLIATAPYIKVATERIEKLFNKKISQKINYSFIPKIHRRINYTMRKI